LPPELSPANGVPMPRGAGFLLTDFSSGGVLGSSMLQFTDGPPRERNQTPSNAPERAPAGTSQCTQYIRFRTELPMLASQFSVHPEPEVLDADGTPEVPNLLVPTFNPLAQLFSPFLRLQTVCCNRSTLLSSAGKFRFPMACATGLATGSGGIRGRSAPAHSPRK